MVRVLSTRKSRRRLVLVSLLAMCAVIVVSGLWLALSPPQSAIYIHIPLYAFPVALVGVLLSIAILGVYILPWLETKLRRWINRGTE